MPKPSRRDALRLASVPAGHPYVTGLGLTTAGVRVLPDPRVPGAPPGRWWPPVMLDPAWIERHAGEFDVMHVHFGVESLSLAALDGVLDALRAHGRPLVHTVHDLTHPQLTDQTHHRRQLERLVAAADALITLTPGAAAELYRDHGCRPLVIPHPAMGGPGPGPGPDPFRSDPAHSPAVGVHLRDLRPGIDGPGTVTRLGDALHGLPGVRGQIFMHDRVRDAAAAEEVWDACARFASLTLHRGPRPDDTALEAELGGLAVSLLPYRHGTHSGWLELCWDLGVPVAGPALGHWAAQHPDPAFRAAFAPADADALRTAIARLLLSPESAAGSSARAATVAARRRERIRVAPELARAHVALYRSLL